MRYRLFFIGVAVIAALAFSVQWWLPNLLFAYSKTELMAPISVAGVEIQMKESWVPIRSSERGFLKLKTKRPTILLTKTRAFPFENARYISISKISPSEAEILKKQGPHNLGVKTFLWGSAIVLIGGQSIFVEKYSLVISDDGSSKSSFLSDINDIKKIGFIDRVR